VAEIATRYTNLELELETGERGSRLAHVSSLLCAISGAPGALVVNNAAPRCCSRSTRSLPGARC